MELPLSGLISVAVGLALWAFLPRGVVLTRELQFRGPDGERQYNTWRVRNDSALTVTITGVVHSGIHTYNSEAQQVEEHELSPGTSPKEDLGLSLRFDDLTLELMRDADERPWNGQKVPPGDTLTAYVNLNRTLTIRYRRSGCLGVFERRTLRIHGGV